MSRQLRLDMDKRFDGDMGSFIAFYTEEAKRQIRDNMKKAIFYINPKGGLLASPFSETVERTLYGLMSP